MLDYDYFDVVCHMDLPKKYGKRPSPLVIEAFAKLLQKVRQRNLVVELNTNGWHCLVNEAFPSPELLEHCARLQIPVVIGSDAHTPDAVGRDAERAADLLRRVGYRHMTGFSRRKRERVPL